MQHAMRELPELIPADFKERRDVLITALSGIEIYFHPTMPGAVAEHAREIHVRILPLHKKAAEAVLTAPWSELEALSK